MTQTKAVVAANYSPEQVATLQRMIAEGATMESIAQAVAKNLRSVVAKASSLGIYKAKAKATTKTGEKVESKEQLVEDIAQAMACTAEELSGLEKSNKATLLRLKAYINAA
jgi:hypothetical protein